MSAPAVQRSPELHYQPLPIVLSAAAAGILVDRFRPLPVGAWCAMAAVALSLWAGATLMGRLKKGTGSEPTGENHANSHETEVPVPFFQRAASA